MQEASSPLGAGDVEGSMSKDRSEPVRSLIVVVCNKYQSIASGRSTT